MYLQIFCPFHCNVTLTRLSNSPFAAVKFHLVYSFSLFTFDTSFWRNNSEILLPRTISSRVWYLKFRLQWGPAATISLKSTFWITRIFRKTTSASNKVLFFNRLTEMASFTLLGESFIALYTWPHFGWIEGNRQRIAPLVRWPAIRKLTELPVRKNW